MSGIAGIFNVPKTPEDLSVWASGHMTHHRDIIRRIRELTDIDLDEYILDPIDPKDTDVWGAQHQQMHQDMEAILGISGFDLTEVDFEEYEELEGWITLNANVHYQAAFILGIG